MPSTIATIPVGSDGHIPVLDKSSLWREWALHQVYMGKEGEGKWVVKPGDWVIDITTGQYFRVVVVEQTTAIPTLEPFVKPEQYPIEQKDPYVGRGPRDSCDLWYVYLDDTVTPAKLAVENRFYVRGSSMSYARIFLGANISPSGQCVSMIYDQNNNLIDDKIPLELAEADDVRNYTTFHVEACHTTTPMTDGDRVTVVVYDDQHQATYIREMIIVKTNFVRTVNSSRDWIENVELVSPFLADNDPGLIEYPMNVPLEGLNLQCIVTYKSGLKKRLPVDGSVCRVTGFEHFTATKVGETFNVYLHYYLQPNEYSYTLGAGPINHITKTYKCRVTRPDGAYNIKLFGFPRWIDATTGYRWRWWVGAMDRTFMKDVTGLVRINENMTPFDGKLYGMVQRVVANINFKDINPSWKDFRHVQPMDVSLLRAGSDHTASNWSLSFNPDGTPVYGLGVHADALMVNQNLWKINISCGAISRDEWLTKLYYNLLPMQDYFAETRPTTPSHFVVVAADGAEYEFSIDMWSSELTINNRLINSDTMMVKFIKKTQNQNILYLAAGGIPVWQTAPNP